MAHSTGYTFGFALGVCVFCSIAVAGTATLLKDRQDLNKERDLKSAILEALQLGGDLDGPAIDETWDDRVQLVFYRPDGSLVTDAAAADLTGDGLLDMDDATAARVAVKGTDKAPELLPLYKRVDDGSAVGAWALPLQGKGLWGPLSGYLALSPDGSTVIGSTFFAPKETPGLGAEIQEPAFEDAWKGKKVMDSGKPSAIAVTKPGLAQGDHAVDGISGATITSRGVDEMVEVGIENHYAAVLGSLN